MSQSAFSSAHFHYVAGLVDAATAGSDTFIVKLAAVQAPSSTNALTSHLVAAALSNHSILLYALQLPSAASPLPAARLLATLRSQSAPITDLAFFNQHSSFPPSFPAAGSHILLSSSEDGTVCLFDCLPASAAPAAVLTPLRILRVPHSAAVYSVAGSGHLVLAGSEGGVLYLYDVRSGRLLQTVSDFHSDDVTCVAFHPLDSSQLFSASLDGTVCHFTLSDPDPDEWLQASFQVEADVRRIGFFGPSADYLYALTTTEQLSLWHIDRALCVSAYPPDIRAGLSAEVGCHVDYLLDCHYQQASQRLFLLAGNNNGSLCITHLNRASLTPAWAHTSSDTTDYNEVRPEDVNVSIWTEESEHAAGDNSGLPSDERKEAEGAQQHAAMEHEQLYEAEAKDAGEHGSVVDPAAAGHTAAVRDVLWLDNVLLSAGNDSKLSVWTSDVRSKPTQQSRQRRRSNANMND